MTFSPRTFAPVTAVATTRPVLPNASELAATNVELRFAATLEPYSEDTSGTVTLRLADGGFCTEPTDTPASTCFEGRLTEPLRLSRRTSGSTYGGRSSLRSASLRFALVDRALRIGANTYTPRTLLSRLALDGRAVEVRAVFGGDFANGIVVFKGTAEDWARARNGEIEVTLRGIGYRLVTPLQPSTYAGTGGLEGPEDLEGQRYPVCLGLVFNIQPVPVVPGELLFQIHTDADGNGAPIQEVIAARIGGVPVIVDTGYANVTELRAAVLAPGTLGVSLSDGYCRLAVTPGADLTMDVRGGVFNGEYTELPGSLMRIVAQHYGPRLAASEINPGAFRTIDAEAPWPVGRFYGPADNDTAEDFLDEAAEAVEGSWGDARDGRLEAFVVRAPGVIPVIKFTSPHVAERSFSFLNPPSDVRPALREVTVGFQQNYTPGGDIAASVSQADRLRFETEWETSVASQTLTQHAEARTFRRNTILATRAGAEGLRDALLALADGRTRRVSWRASHKALAARPGMTVDVTVPDEGYEAEPVRLTGADFSARSLTFSLEGIVRDG
ncbi:MAG: hypothetical protein AAF968_04670 [Pseudomonadota bacterium]